MEVEVIFQGRQFDTAPFREDNCPVLRIQFASGHFFEKTIVHCLEDKSTINI